MSYIFNIYFWILFITNFNFYNSNELLIENPKIILSEDKNPIVFNGNEQYYHIITIENIYIIEKFTGSIKVINSSISYSSPYFLCEDEFNNHFLFSNKEFYGINLDSNFESIYLNKMNNIDANANFAGCFKHYKYDKNNDLKVEEGEMIIYGKTGTKLCLYYINKKIGYDITNHQSPGEKISCKLIYNIRYICIFISGKILYADILLLTKDYWQININIKNEKLYNFEGSDNTDNFIFFDTKNVENKFLCYKKQNDNNNICYIIKISFTDSSKQNFDSASVSKVNVNFEFLLDEKNCDFTWFYAEYLICCSGENIISCYRLNDDFHVIDQFDLNINGQNSNLHIINNTDFASLFYINENSNSDKKLFEYIIYPPECQNISKEIIVFHDFEVNLTFDIKTRNSYNLQFYDLPEDYNISINGEKLKEDEQIKINQKENIFYFNPKNNNYAKNLTITYKISIEAKYSSTCKIDLTILPCYRSCHKCFKWKLESDENNHNCLLNECEQDYYESPLNENNCYSLEEKNKSWYLDNTTNKYGICHEECFECSGPRNTD